jgi:hypothetical protein
MPCVHNGEDTHEHQLRPYTIRSGADPYSEKSG